MDARLKPMSLWISLALFGIPGVFIYWGMYSGVPWLAEHGVPMEVAFALLSVTGVILLIVSLIAYRLDGYAWNWKEFRDRFRLHAFRGKEWLWVVGVFLVCTVSDEALQVIGKWMATIPFFAPPDYLPPMFHPLKEVVFPPTEFLGAPLKGNWGILALWLPLTLVSMVGEEFMWRGYILPRQELRFGRWAWVVNGLMWAFLVHACMKWAFIGMLPSMLLTPWIAQKLKNTNASLFVHVFGNVVLFWMFLISGVLGLGG
jgi:membrane protease YdiL (CAAX protease family)